MNFSPFGSHFPGSIPGIHQFTASGAALVSSATSAVSATTQDSVNRYHTSNVNMTHFNQPHPPILGKFRGALDDTITSPSNNTSSNMNKYNGHSNQYGVTSYAQQQTTQDTSTSSPDKQRLVTSSYPQTSTSLTTTQSAVPEISQDLCNAILQQQNDAKRGLPFSAPF